MPPRREPRGMLVHSFGTTCWAMAAASRLMIRCRLSLSEELSSCGQVVFASGLVLGEGTASIVTAVGKALFQ